MLDHKNHKEFLSNILINELSGCWEWQGCVNNAGYGQMTICGFQWFMHRYSYSYYMGEIKDKLVLHKCDNRKCCNPDHLFLGTHSDNMRDKVSKGRHHAGKLRAYDVSAIRKLLKSGLKQKDISTKYGVAFQTISDIALGKTWRSIK